MLFQQISNFYSYETVFKINSQKNLDDLWSYCIFRLNLVESEYVYDRFARLYNLLIDYKTILSSSEYINITLKESSEEYSLFFQTTITSFVQTLKKRLEMLNLPYKYENNILSYLIQKRDQSLVQKIKVEPLQSKVHDFIIKDDLEEMVNCIEKLQDSNYEKAYEIFSLDELTAYRTALSYYSSFLHFYPQLNVICNIIAELSVILSLYSDACLRLGNDFRGLLQSFVSNIVFWQEKLFFSTEEELNFLDNSFEADLAQIKMMLNLYDGMSKDSDLESLLDDIFDF